jgi:hypothetical protein
MEQERILRATHYYSSINFFYAYIIFWIVQIQISIWILEDIVHKYWNKEYIFETK